MLADVSHPQAYHHRLLNNLFTDYLQQLCSGHEQSGELLALSSADDQHHRGGLQSATPWLRDEHLPRGAYPDVVVEPGSGPDSCTDTRHLLAG